MQMEGGGIESLSTPLLKVIRTQVMSVHLRDLRWFDFYLVDNQIPMVLLERVVDNLRTGGCKFIEAWKHEQWQGRNIEKCVRWFNFDRHGICKYERDIIFRKRMEKRLRLEGGKSEFEAAPHMLDKTYSILCGDSHGGHDDRYHGIQSATYLEACGVRIQGKEFTCFEDISFERGCLWIPFLRIYVTTERYLHNLVVHEELTYGETKCCARSYTKLMENLMTTNEDIDLLVKWGVVDVHVGTRDIVLKMWKTIVCNVTNPYLTKQFLSTVEKVNKYVRQRRNKLRFEFMKSFCSRPWIVLSVIAATLVTIATLIQTYVNIISSNGMQPYFPPH
jgi:hypothetical protein